MLGGEDGGRRSKQRVALLLETSYFLAYSLGLRKERRWEEQKPLILCIGVRIAPPLPGINRWMVSEVIIVRLGQNEISQMIRRFGGGVEF